MVTLLIFIVILGVIIFVHELGHFLFAKMLGVYVYEFSLGMGPRVFCKKGKNRLLLACYSYRRFCSISRRRGRRR